jgi:hypothetical protein
MSGMRDGARKTERGGHMKRVRRWSFHVAAAISLLLFIAWLAIWSAHLLPHRGWWLWAFPHGQDSSFPAVGPDRFGVDFYWVSPPRNRWPAADMHWAGFHLKWFQATTKLGLRFMHILTVPSWFGMPLLITPAAVWACVQLRAKQRRRHRTESGLCAACGYDLRASPERCPECGESA